MPYLAIFIPNESPTCIKSLYCKACIAKPVLQSTVKCFAQKLDSVMSQTYHHPVQIYYEDTDHSGVVYHPNFLKYFERAREHVIDSDRLAMLWNEKGLGFAVYKANLICSRWC